MGTMVGEDRTAAAASAVRHHYDVGRDFYSLWLDPSMTYSCAMWDGEHDSLEAAQERKLEYHLRAVSVEGAESLLDVGCGWGSLLERATGTHGVKRAVGLTLSDDQAAFVARSARSGVEVRTESWMGYEPGARFDGIVSIGAFEHFATPEDSPAARARVYREFFSRSRSWLEDDGALSLQTIAYANMSRADASKFFQEEIFPNADLPTFAEIASAAEGIFAVRLVRNDALDYARTLRAWASRLRSRRDEAATLVGPDVVARYERYLREAALGFRMGKLSLLRLVFDPYGTTYFRRSSRSHDDRSD
jgi:cyclopropane-fatty-acyl-phospholipid synthase